MKAKKKPKPKEYTKPRRWKQAYKINKILDRELKDRLEREE